MTTWARIASTSGNCRIAGRLCLLPSARLEVGNFLEAARGGGRAGGLSAVNASALLAAVEFGIQPMLFHDAHGMPLYAPYPLSIAVPAMMIGHLTFAGIAEAAISAGLVAYLQVADPGLLLGSSGLGGNAVAPSVPQLRSLRRLWLTVAILMLLTPGWES